MYLNQLKYPREKLGGDNEQQKPNQRFVIVHNHNSHLIYVSDLEVTNEFGDFYPRTWIPLFQLNDATRTLLINDD